MNHFGKNSLHSIENWFVNKYNSLHSIENCFVNKYVLYNSCEWWRTHIAISKLNTHPLLNKKIKYASILIQQFYQQKINFKIRFTYA